MLKFTEISVAVKSKKNYLIIRQSDVWGKRQNIIKHYTSRPTRDIKSKSYWSGQWDQRVRLWLSVGRFKYCDLYMYIKFYIWNMLQTWGEKRHNRCRWRWASSCYSQYLQPVTFFEKKVILISTTVPKPRRKYLMCLCFAFSSSVLCTILKSWHSHRYSLQRLKFALEKCLMLPDIKLIEYSSSENLRST